MRKNIFLVFVMISFILISSSFISAICCEKVKDSNMWCQDVTDKNQCETSLGGKTYRTWDYNFCNDVPECTGTCVNSIEGGSNLGICSENTPKTQCEESKGTWSQMEVEEINACKEICCFVGKDTYYVSNARCTALSEEYGIEVKMREVASREACLEQQTNIKEGACVISTPTEKACVMSTNVECTSSNINKFSDRLKVENPSNINVRFYDGLLCTASMGGMGISDCARSEDTICKENKVYYKDTCGNLANVYDSSKYNDADYWSYIKDSYDPQEVCTVTPSGSNTCGNCEPTENTVCRDYREVSGATRPANNANGLMCGDLSCWYDANGNNRKENNEMYKHGESWCAESPGTLIIQRNLTTGVIFESTLAKLENASKYNLPGSRYYKLICSFGEVLVEECGDYRSSVCMQGINDYSHRKEASCVFNPWTICLNTMTRTGCEEAGSLCKWIPGYRWDWQIVSEVQRKEMQGSCVPLIAPGFDFWKATGQGNLICGMGSVQVNTLFETPVTRDRDNIDSWDDGFLAERCIDSCYAIPGYANEFNQRPNEEKLYPEEIPGVETPLGITIPRPETEYQRLTIYYDESEYNLPNRVSTYSLSLRRGHYCNKDGEPTHWLTGRVTGSNYDCTPGAGSEAKDERKERDYPIFLTNDEWIKSITDRGRSIGDCGYKANTLGEYTSPEKEMITAMFQKLKQDMTVKKNVTVEQIIYMGGRYLDEEDLRDYETQMAIEASDSYSCGDIMGVCATSEELCTSNGGTISAEGTCWGESKCCVYPQEE